ncbi:hypothetical protein ABFS82_13G140000 [Erythranthe guttata]|uniref:Uncharacterized protein n=1 Tax=Erythranthe guttata TaxID=4155 RepID=A0A022QI56_ERYGU|nr:PREDICTED: uncharacterized protein LOC105968532 [Erythranthe guttata]EYU27626.1 hypothetical protein MIMGU_mgv1a015953mg [Erythranthe guttata]EYU27627.1 hypothetical protein MIMGU_mgv1a015953mg [Erythranthe guttata]|eukprot:XP_012848619.1 PREDICTED: uncharacterized protein LOC105968532 [Erythranthe guttata]
MERDSKNNQNKKKRTRDNHDESWPHKSKKPLESVVVVENNIIDQEKPCYEFCDSSSIGVFDFPWMNKGVGFIMAGEYFEPEEKFAPINFDDGNLFVGDGNLQENKVDDNYEDGFNWSLKVDDLESVDNCIWSFVIDQPLS